jgi:hypothetical protein
MHALRYRWFGLALLLGCQACSDDAAAPSNSGMAGAAGTTNSGSSGTQPSGGSTLAGGGSGTCGGSGGSGAPATNGGSSAQAGGGTGGSATSGAGGTGGGAGSGGSATTGGSAGASGCVKNLSCKLSPPPSSGDLYQDCVDRINQFLTECACLPALKRATEGEACADQMAEYDAGQNTAHAGARAKICKPAGSQNECPGYSSNNQVISLCFQQMWDEGPPPAGDCTGTCYEEHGHFINMTDPSVTKVACGFYTTSSGKVWAAQNFF